jgi:hypothetical protein
MRKKHGIHKELEARMMGFKPLIGAPSFSYRFDPTFGIATYTIMAAMAAGTTMSMVSQIQAGKQAQDIANANAKIQLQQAEAAKKAADEKARIQAERGRQLIERQKSLYAASNVKMNIGAPLVVEAQTQADLAKDIGYTLEQGRNEQSYLQSSAAISKQEGKNIRQQSIWNATATGLSGFGSLAYMGYKGGMFDFGKKPTFEETAQWSQRWLDR